MNRPQCAVRGCTNVPDRVFVEDKTGLRLEYLVCEEHDLELRYAPWATDERGGQILIGADAPAELLTYTITQTVGASQVEFVFGRDGQETQRVRAFVKPEHIRDICYWVSGADHGPEAD